MNLKHKYKSVIILLLFNIMAVAAIAADNSGFLDDYSKLQPDPDRNGAMRYIRPDASVANYGKIAITPIEIWYAPDSEYKGISPDNLKLIANNLQNQIVSELETAYPVVGSAGSDVLALRIAITNVKFSGKIPDILNILPVGMVLFALQEIAGANVILDDAVIEAELLDSSTVEQLGMLVDQLSLTGAQPS